jgi:hypothetical protein
VTPDSTQSIINWRQRLQSAIAENPYAEYAKVSDPEIVLHILHGEPGSVDEKTEVDSQPAQVADLPLMEPTRAMSWSEWKADALNRLFKELGTSGQRGRITAATVEHGERRF